MTTEPAVSVIVPTHNVGHWVRECLSSILEDQDVDFEVIVVDDNSTDDTRQIVSAIAVDDDRLRLVRSIGSGGAQARNLGVELARGEYIVFCDGDDLVPRGAYARMLSRARETGADMVVGNFIKFWSTRTWRPTRRWPEFDEDRVGVTLLDAVSLIRNRACWNRMFRRQFWVDERIYFPSVPRSNDIVPMTKALVSAKRIDVITEDVYLYRGRPGDGSMSARAAGLESYVSYLTQELQCCVLVASLGDANLRSEYDDLFLSADGWVHLRNFLDQAQHATYDKADLERARRHLVAVMDSLDPASFERLRLERRVVYALAAAGSWEAAGRLMRAIKPATEAMPDGLWFLEHVAQLVPSRILPAEQRDRAATRRLVPLLMDSSEVITPDLVAVLASHLDLFRRVFSADDVVHELPAGGQQLVRALMSGDKEVIKDRLADGLIRVTPEFFAVHRGSLVLRATVTGPRANGLGVYAACGETRRAFRRLRVDADAGTLEARLPTFRLGVGHWSIRVVVPDAVLPVDAEIMVRSSVVTERGRRGARAVIRAHPDGRRGQVVIVRHHAVPRAGRRILRAVVRRIRAGIATSVSAESSQPR